MAPTEADAAEGGEVRVFSNVISTFRQYSQYSLSSNNRRRRDLFKLPKADQEVFIALGYRDKLNEVDEAIIKNAEFIEEIVDRPEIFGVEAEMEVDDEGCGGHSAGGTGHTHSHGGPQHSHSHGGPSSHSHSHDGPDGKYRPSEHDMDKLRSTLKQFVRDWSAEGRPERDMCYEPMKDALLAHFKDRTEEERKTTRVLVPGAGLGRLAFDVANLGFHTQGNEFSHYMLLASYFILNRTSTPFSHTIYPYVHSFSNAYSKESILRGVKIPDVEVAIKNGTRFELVAGDFEEIYGQDANHHAEELDADASNQEEEEEVNAGQFDAILTCFFIDTAKNPLAYLRILHRILKPGGVWINLGPLLWHFENNQSGDVSVELDLEEVKRLCEVVGFEIKDHRQIDATYTNNPESMLGYVYHAQFWTATKKAE
ncbi:N2227-domain-containing protein [Cylindrobasidium torrendii FP15055 ss-10]|uniref:carnosine N-methyltransferase n=1 Tax=Cylindrobasidium torrendii FP15055 ss-10 TaxID=1314674 RepID=A0A0D7B4T5_9AGAR|nr:N2227-domain-containing protein [Cylindrobasidium torrendii FP15055 ss-10]